ncbi:MAG: NUDIX hydrolase [Vicinamibacterales bacterium]
MREARKRGAAITGGGVTGGAIAGGAVPQVIRKVFEGRVFSVAVETITLPNGHRLDAEVVRHPRSVVIVPIDDEGRVILVRQYRHAVGRWLWELPAGSTNPGEDEHAAAARECHEEVGLVPSKLERLGAFFPTPGYCDEEMVFFRATGLREPGPGEADAHADADEEIEPCAFTVAAAQALVASGEIADLKTVAGLALVSGAGR